MTKEIKYCPRCKNELILPVLSDEEKRRISGLVQSEKPIMAVKLLQEEKNLSLKEGKLIVDHIVRQKGKCRRCKFSHLSKEIEVCPICKCLNLNW